LEEGLIQPTAAGLAEGLFTILDGECVLGEGAQMRFLTALRSLAKAIRVRGSSHSLRTWCDGIHTAGRVPLCCRIAKPWAVYLVGLVDVAHHDLGFDSVSQARKATGGFDFVGNPLPITTGFEGDGGSGRELGTEFADRASNVLDSAFYDWFGQRIKEFKLGAAFVSIQAYTMYSCFPTFCDIS
jgi:hypothetical protein